MTSEPSTEPGVAGRAGPRLDFDRTGDPTGGATVSRQVLDAAVDIAATRTNRLTLRFASGVLEKAFHQEYRQGTVKNAPVALGLALVLVVAFGLLDALIQPTVVNELWFIRYGIMTPYLILAMALCYIPALHRYVEAALLGLVPVVGGGILAMILISPAPGRYFYYAGLILVIVYNYTLIRVRFSIVNVAGWMVAVAYLAAELIVGLTPWQILVNNMFFFASACILGMFAAYFTESLARQNFLQDKLVRRAREFGSYRLVANLGRGGMGEVWRAEHRLLARPAAIKLIRGDIMEVDDAARRKIVQRFEREAQAIALLRSPHTIELYDFGITEDGTFYYVMELLRGYDLRSLVRRFGSVRPQRAVGFLLQACDSLAEAHYSGLIHRDVKPANLVVSEYGRRHDFVKVLDFGIAAWTGEASGGGTEATMERFAGTPSCMAPEQILGDRAVDARTDLYGLGCVAYWMLTGHQVFEAENDMQVLARHIGTPASAPSRLAPEPIPADLDAVVLACLEKDPADRPQSAEELAERLQACAVGAAWSVSDARAWWEANPPPSHAADDDASEQRTIQPSSVLISAYAL